MLIKRSLLFVLMVAFAAPSAVSAQDETETSGGSFFNFYTLSLGVGTAAPINPEDFKDNYSPTFGFNLGFGAQKNIVEIGVDFDYSFFLLKDSASLTPDDINILNLFLVAKIKPLKSKARPYLVVGGGLYRWWIVEAGENESVLGACAGLGFEAEISRRQRIYLEVKSVHGQTRKTPDKANTESITGRFGLMWVFG